MRAPRNGQRLSRSTLEQNAILQGLGDAAAAHVLKESTFVHLALRAQIYEPEQEITRVLFPLTCVLSVVTVMQDGTQIEIGTIGREGLSAIPLLFGASTTANNSYCQVLGDAVEMPADLFRDLMRTNAPFRQLLDRYVQAFIKMLRQLAACNRLHTVYERCARWLLMTRDRVNGDTIPLTDEFLAMMLRTGRSGVSIAAGTLQQAGFIKYAHGLITISNRAGLEAVSCECYQVARQQFKGLLRRVNGHDGH